MSSNSNNYKNHGPFQTMSLVVVVTSLLTGSAFAGEESNYECSLNGSADSTLPGCPNQLGGGSDSSTTPLTSNGTCTTGTYCGAKANAAKAVTPIDAWSICRWVDSNSASSVFVPFRSHVEWSSFVRAAPQLPQSISLVHCAVPLARNGSPATSTITPPYQDATSFDVSNPDLYGRTNTGLWPVPATLGPAFTAHGGKTSMQVKLQWKAGDVDATAYGQPTWLPNFRYSPDIVLTATEDSDVTLNWSIVPFDATEPLSCSVSSSIESDAWGPDANGAPRSGSSTVSPTDETTYTLTCTENGLTSVASVTAQGAGKTCTASYTSPGTYTFVVPKYKEMTVSLWGGGGGGANAIYGDSRASDGSSGGTTSAFAISATGGSGGTTFGCPAAPGSGSGGTVNIAGSPGVVSPLVWYGGNGGAGANGGAGGIGSGWPSGNPRVGGYSDGTAGTGPGGGGGGEAGGSGITSPHDTFDHKNGGGGGGGGYASTTFAKGALTVGSTVTFTVGQGGSQGWYGGQGNGHAKPGAPGAISLSWTGCTTQP